MTRTGRRRAPYALPVLVALLAATPARAAAPVEYYAEVNRDRIGLDETVTLTVTLAYEGDEPERVDLPAAPEFETLSSSRSNQTSMTMTGAGVSVKRVRKTTLVLRPLKEGRLTIEPGVAVADGQKVQTGRIVVEVGPAGSGAPPPSARRAPSRPPVPGFPTPPGFPDPFDDFDTLFGGGKPPEEGDLFLRASLDKDRVYVGEQVTLAIHLFARVDVSGVEGLKMPRLDGFWSEDVENPGQISGSLREVNGVTYRVYPIRKRALFPLQAGKATIEPVEIDVSTGMGFFSTGRKVHRKSQRLTLEVKPLPAGAPAGFSPGNVGDWTLEVSADRTETTVGTPVTVKVIARGRGNLRNLEPPALPKLDGFKVFDPTRTETTDVKRGKWGGEKVLEYVLVPDRAGTTTVPALTLALFDPAAGVYREVSSQPLTLSVLPGAGAAATPPVAAAPGVPAAGLRGLRPTPEIATARVPLYDRPWFWSLLALPVVVVAGAALAPRLASVRRRGEGDRRVKRAGAAAKKRLAAAADLARRRDRGFFAELDRALHEYLALKLGRPTAGLTRESLAALLGEAGVSADTTARLVSLLDACDAGRFAPGDVDGARVDAALADAGTLLGELETVLGRRSR